MANADNKPLVVGMIGFSRADLVSEISSYAKGHQVMIVDVDQLDIQPMSEMPEMPETEHQDHGGGHKRFPRPPKKLGK